MATPLWSYHVTEVTSLTCLPWSGEVCGSHRFASADYSHVQSMHVYTYGATCFTGEMCMHTGLLRSIIRIHKFSFVTHVPISAESETRCTCQSSRSASVICTSHCLPGHVWRSRVVTVSAGLDIHVATITIVVA